MTNYFTTPNVITSRDVVPDIDFKFKNDFKLKPYQKATIQKMLTHEDKFFVTTEIPRKFENVLTKELEDKDNIHAYPSDTISVRHSNFERINSTTSRLNFHTNIGVLSNNVGSGKTSIVLGLIKHKKTMKSKYSYSNFMRGLVYDTMLSFPKDLTNIIADFHDPSVTCQLLTHYDPSTEQNNLIKINEQRQFYIRSNMILVPHNLFLQWKSEIKNITTHKVKCIHSKRDLKFTKEEAQNGYFDKYDIVLVNANKLKALNELTDNCVWSRVFIDEVDTINIPNFPEIQSYFLWFVSTTYERILKPKNKGFINNLFRVERSYYEDHPKLYDFLLNSITYTCDKNYINQYLKLDKPEYNYIQYESPFINRLLYNLDIKTINKFINSNDYKSIIGYFSGTNRWEFENMVSDYYYDNDSSRNSVYISREDINNESNFKINMMIVCLLKLRKQVKSAKRTIEYRIREYTDYKDIALSRNDEEYWVTTKEAKIKYKSIQKNCLNTIKNYFNHCKKLEYIKDQFIQNRICLFCHNQTNQLLYNSSGMRCRNCFSSEAHIQSFKHNFFFFNELSVYKNRCNNYIDQFDLDSNKSPLKENNTNTLFGLTKQFNLEGVFEYKEPTKITVNKKMFDYDIKITKLIELINKDKAEKKRVLVFSDSIDFFNKIKSNLEEREITFKCVKGNGHVINSILRKYTSGEVSVLLLNMKYFGSGLNLQCTDKIYIMNYLDKETNTQVVGRANRYGREGKLEVNYIFYNEEYLSYINNSENNSVNGDDEGVEEI